MGIHEQSPGHSAHTPSIMAHGRFLSRRVKSQGIPLWVIVCIDNRTGLFLLRLLGDTA